MTNQTEQYARRMSRGALLQHLYRMQDMGACDPATPRTATRAMIRTLGAYGTMPPPELEINSLRWLEGGGYVTVDWAMDDGQNYETVTITQKGIDLYEAKDAARREPGILLQPRR